MKPLFLFFIFLFLSLHLQSQDKGNTPLEPILKRTYPIDSCLYFTLPFDSEVRTLRNFGNGNTGVTIHFSSTSPTGGITRGIGGFIIDPTQFPIADWTWSPGQKGKVQIILPDSAAGGGTQDLTGEGNFINFPVLVPGFILEVEGNILPSPFLINFQLRALETEL